VQRQQQVLDLLLLHWQHAHMTMSLRQVLPQLQPATPGKTGSHCNGMQVWCLQQLWQHLVWLWQQGNVSLEQPLYSLQWQQRFLTLLVQMEHLSIDLTQELQRHCYWLISSCQSGC